MQEGGMKGYMCDEGSAGGIRRSAVFIRGFDVYSPSPTYLLKLAGKTKTKPIMSNKAKDEIR